MEQAITACIEGLQQAFGSRIERIFGSGGGLIAVLDRVDAEADRMAGDLSRTVPVALLDRIAMNGLARLGAASPLTETRTYYDAAEAAQNAGKSRLANLAAEKMKAARILIDQVLPESALEMLLGSLLAAAADRADLDTPVDVKEAGVWIYSEALPNGILDQDEAGLVMRAIGLAQCAAVPTNMLAELAGDIGLFVGKGK